MNTERVEAAAKALWNATLPGIAWDELREASREPVRVQARAALTADDAASGEELVFYNDTDRVMLLSEINEGGGVVDGNYFILKPKHELVVRKVREV